MGCCGSSSANVQDLAQNEKAFIRLCCKRGLEEQKPDEGLHFIVSHLLRQKKSQQDIYNLIVVDDKELHSYKSWPEDCDGEKSMKQRIQIAQNYARTYTLRDFGRLILENEKLGLSKTKDDEKKQRALKDFVQKAVEVFMPEALKDKIKELVVSGGDNDRPGKRQESNSKNGTATNRGANNNNNNQSNATTPSRSGVYKKDETAANLMPTPRKTGGNTARTQNNDETPAVSQKQQKATAAAAASAKNDNNKSRNGNDDADGRDNGRRKQQPVPSFKLAPQEKCPRPTPPENVSENCWVICNDCTFYWNEHKELYWDPKSKLYFDAKSNMWTRTDPTMSFNNNNNSNNNNNNNNNNNTSNSTPRRVGRK